MGGRGGGSLQKCPIDTRASEGSIVGPTFLLYMSDPPDEVL